MSTSNLNNIKERLQDTNLQENLSNVKDNLQAVKDSVEKTVTDAKQDAEKKIRHSIKKVAVQSISLQRNITAYVKENPRKSLGLAIAAGALISKLL